jgi:hypothetical protein
MIRHLTAVVSVALILSACAGPKGPDGTQGPPGPKGDTGPGFMTSPSVSAVTPSRLAASLTADVSVSGFATSWTSAAQVSFGQGITVNKVTVGSNTGLLANITVAKDAMPGTRDVKVTDGSQVSTFTGVFTVVPLFDVTPVGTATRGGYWYFDVHANDPDFSFPADTDVAVAPQPTDGGTITADVSSLKPRAAVVQLHSDFLAPLAAYNTTLTWDNSMGKLPLPQFTLGEKVELMLGDGAPLMDVLMDAYESKLVKYTPGTTPGEVVLHVSAGAGSTPQLILLDATGNPQSISGSMGAPGPGNDLVLTGDAMGTYLALSETSGAANAQFTVTAIPMVMAVPEVTPDSSMDTAMPLTFDALASDTGVRVAATNEAAVNHWFKLTAGAGDVGKRFHIREHNANYIWFTFTVHNADGSTFAQQHVSNITNDLYTPAIPAAGDYFLEADGDDDGAYDLIISMQ